MDEEFRSGVGDDGPAGHPDQVFCECGEAWFEGGLIAFEKDGQVNGVSGWLRCMACGAPFVSEAAE